MNRSGIENNLIHFVIHIDIEDGGAERVHVWDQFQDNWDVQTKRLWISVFAMF